MDDTDMALEQPDMIVDERDTDINADFPSQEYLAPCTGLGPGRRDEELPIQNLLSNTVNIDELVDIQNIQIDASLPVMEKKKSYYNQIKTPNCFRFGDMVVRVSFLDSGPSLQDRLKQYLLSGQGVEITSA